MAADGAADTLGVRYASPDPTLPEPWKGLIDGSSGAMYYWNSETNVTQYERPAALVPPVPSGPPPVPSEPKPASLQVQPNGASGQQAHQMYSTPEQQMPPQQGNNNLPQSYQGAHMDPSQGYQYPHQQPMHHMGYQPNMPQQRPPNVMQQPQHLQQYPHQQDHRAAYNQRDGAPLAQNPPSAVNSVQTPPIGQPGQAAQYAGPQFNMQQPSPYGQMQQSGVDYQQHGPKYPNQMGQQPNVPQAGSKMGFEDNPPGRGANDHYYNGGPAMAPLQPKLAAIPMARTQPDMRSGGHPHQNLSPNIPGGPTSHNMYGQPGGPPFQNNAMMSPPFQNNAMMRPNPAVMASADAMNLSSVDVYRQKHDVTATVCLLA